MTKKYAFLKIIILALLFSGFMASAIAQTTQNNKITSHLNKLADNDKIFPEIKKYTKNAQEIKKEYIERYWSGETAYIEKTEILNNGEYYIRVRTYMSGMNPVMLSQEVANSRVHYYRESWYYKTDAAYIENELHPYSKRIKALIDLNLYWDNSEYKEKTWKVNQLVLRNLKNKEKSIIISNFKIALKEFI